MSEIETIRDVDLTDCCPWLGFSGGAGTLEYALSVFKWMEHEFGEGRHCIICREEWWSVEERAADNDSHPLSCREEPQMESEAGEPPISAPVSGSPQRGNVGSGNSVRHSPHPPRVGGSAPQARVGENSGFDVPNPKPWKGSH